MSEWISVEDELPKIDVNQRWGIFIVCDIDKNVFVGYFHRNDNKFLGEPYGFRIELVTHWMPLPEPPK